MKKFLCILLVICMSMAMFAGCGSQNNAQTEAAAPVADSKDIVLNDPSSSGELQRGGTLVLAMSKQLEVGLDITKINDCSSQYTLVAQIYEPLLTMDENGNPSPCLATEYAFSEDGLSMTLKLREDVSFSNGEKFNAEAAAKCLNWYISDECEHIFKSSDLYGVDSVDVVDEYTIRINFSVANASMDMILAASVGRMVAPSTIDNGDFATNLIGTGPFVLEEYREGEYATLKANPNYYRMGEDGKPLPYLDGIKYLFVSDDTTQMTNLKSGDIMGVDRLGSSTAVMTAQAMDNMALYQNPSTEAYNVTFNVNDAVLSNVTLRQAICYALNPQEIIDIALEGFGVTRPFWTDSGKWFYYDYTPYSYDPEKAKELLTEAGYADGLKLEIAVIAREPDNTIAQLVQAQLAQVGIDLTINSMDVASWAGYVQKEHRQQLSLALAGNGGYHPSKNWVNVMKSFGGDSDILTKLNDCLTESKVRTDRAEAYEAVKEYQETVLDNGVACVLGHKYMYGAFATNVHGITLDYYGWFMFDQTWLEG